MARSGLRIAVTGLAATYPFGGVFWDYMQYVLGLHRLGHEVLYIEDTGKWCYNPRLQTFVQSGGDNARYLQQQLERLDPAVATSWFYRDATGACFGRSWEEVTRFCREADLFIHISASCWMREEYFAARRVAFIDSDPMYTQRLVPGYVADELPEDERGRVDMLRQHDVFFTFGETMHHDDSVVPTELFDWIPTRQPIVLDCFAPEVRVPVDQRRRVLTTIASWEPTEKGPVVRGVKYTGKSREFERFIDLPRHSRLPLELALSGGFPRDRLEAAGWRVREALEVSADPWLYRDYLARSLGEWSVAKHAYVASLSGWFSCRTACYLALGVPAVVQDTGFSRVLPTGEGLLAFRTPDEALAGIDAIATDPAKHAKAARDMAHAHFDAGRVLSDLVGQAMQTTNTTASQRSVTAPGQPLRAGPVPPG